jgi:AraC-like DNA-binding protein
MRDFIGFISKDPDVASMALPCFVHKSPYCLFIKSNYDMLLRCRDSGRLLFKKCQSNDSFFLTSCYCGYTDFVMPVKYNDVPIVAICISGFKGKPEMMERRMGYACKRYGQSKETLSQAYTRSLWVEKPNFEHMKIVCGILGDFFLMYFSSLVSKGLVNPSAPYIKEPAHLYVLASILEYIQFHYTEDIRVSDIAAFCRCSESYINHIFKKNMNRNINFYINEVRINEAKKRLISGEQIGNIATLCGFSDPNYFSVVFKKISGVTPMEFKKSILSRK